MARLGAGLAAFFLVAACSAQSRAWQSLRELAACLGAEGERYIESAWATSARSTCTLEAAKAACISHSDCGLIVLGFNGGGARNGYS